MTSVKSPWPLETQTPFAGNSFGELCPGSLLIFTQPEQLYMTKRFTHSQKCVFFFILCFYGFDSSGGVYVCVGGGGVKRWCFKHLKKKTGLIFPLQSPG